MELENEIWLPVVGYEGHYEVSDMGRIRSLDKMVNVGGGGKKFSPGKIIDLHKNKRGYVTACLCREGDQKTKRVNVIVAKAHLPNPKNKKTVNHKFGVKDDNRASQLEWSSHSENVKHAYDTGLKLPQQGVKNGHAKLKESEVVDIINMYRGGDYLQKELAKKFNVSEGAVRDIISRKNWKYLSI